jgi:hypothetical protein
MIMGRENTRVLPDPVKAMPIMSRPDRATGKPCRAVSSIHIKMSVDQVPALVRTQEVLKRHVP